jgi:hypothetical protein
MKIIKESPSYRPLPAQVTCSTKSPEYTVPLLFNRSPVYSTHSSDKGYHSLIYYCRRSAITDLYVFPTGMETF